MNFLDAAEQIGQLLKAYDKMMPSENSEALWSRTKFHIKQKLDAAGLTLRSLIKRLKLWQEENGLLDYL